MWVMSWGTIPLEPIPPDKIQRPIEGGDTLNPDGEKLPDQENLSSTRIDAPVDPPWSPVQSIPSPPVVPAGWYPDPDNTRGVMYGGVPSMRYFDGTQWTEHRSPMQRQQQRQLYPQQPIFIQQNVVAPPVVVHNSGGSSSMAGLHLLLTIFTCGLWLPIWIIIEIIQAVTKK